MVKIVKHACNVPSTVELIHRLYSEQHQKIPSSYQQLNSYIRDSSGLPFLQRSAQIPQQSRCIDDLMNVFPSLKPMLGEVLCPCPLYVGQHAAMHNQDLSTRFGCLHLLIKCSKRIVSWCKLAMVEPTATTDANSVNIVSIHLMLSRVDNQSGTTIHRTPYCCT